MMMKSHMMTCAALAVLAMPAIAQAQEFGGAPYYGTISYRGADAQLSARAGGAMSLDQLNNDCYGYASAQPSFAVEVSQPGLLYIATGSDIDLTLAVRAPDGTVSCDDDGAGNLNPGVMISDAMAGTYEVWLGTLSAGVGYPQVIAHASPTGFITDNPFVLSVDPDAPADMEVTLSGTGGQSWSTSLRAGGEARLEVLNTDDTWCAGYAGANPDLALEFNRASGGRYFLLDGESDTTLAIVTPSGAVFCNDDQIGLNAGIYLPELESGAYKIFAGLLGDQNRTEPVELSVSATGFGGVDRNLQLNATPRFGRQTLDLDASDPESFTVQAGGDVEAGTAIMDDDVYCSGYVAREPSLTLDYGDSEPLHISMTSEGDTTLAVYGPDGQWACDDDSFGNGNPALIMNAGPGVYTVFAGTYAEDDSEIANVYLSNIGPGENPESLRMDPDGAPAHGRLSLSSGFDPRALDVAAGGESNPSYNGMDDYCPGNFPTTPHVSIDWSGGDRLSFLAEAEGDTTLAIFEASQGWMCDDDSGGDLNAAIKVEIAPAGMYQVFVGTYSGDGESATLIINEEDVLDHAGSEEHYH